MSENHIKERSLLSRMHADNDIVQYAQLPEKSAVLKGPCHPSPGYLMGFPPNNILVLKPDLTFIRFIDARNHVEKGRLAGPIRANEAYDLTGVDIKIHPVEGS